MGILLAALGQTHQVQDTLGLLFDFFPGPFLHIHAEGDVLFHGQPGHGGRFLKNEGQVMLFGVSPLPVNQDFP